MRVVDTRVAEVNEPVKTVFSGLSPLVVEDVADEGERIVVRARTLQDAAVCPVCGAPSGRVHGYQLRTVADVPIDDRRVVVRVRVRRLVCPTLGCCRMPLRRRIRRHFPVRVPAVRDAVGEARATVSETAGAAPPTCSLAHRAPRGERLAMGGRAASGKWARRRVPLSIWGAMFLHEVGP
ncbi:hypothetical protein GCM10022206_58940 [Streptomyces chiangmaiensis]